MKSAHLKKNKIKSYTVIIKDPRFNLYLRKKKRKRKTVELNISEVAKKFVSKQIFLSQTLSRQIILNFLMLIFWLSYFMK